MSLKDFDIVSKLGDGAYSTVYKVSRKADGHIYALKRVKMNSLSIKQKENALNEIRILASINHKNVVSYKQAFVDQNTKSLYIVMEFCNQGDLSRWIQQKQQKAQLFKEEQIWNIFIQAVKGLNQLHQLNIFHRDIKPANIFLHEENGEICAKLGDMNVSKISQEGLCMTQTGTPYYASPQIWKDKPYNQKSDIWSLGCVLYEMITLQPPFKAEDMEGLFKKVIRGIYPKIPSQFSQQLSSMIRFMLQVNPQMRPSCEKVLKIYSGIKKTAQNSPLKEQKIKLLQTIRAGLNFSELNQCLPKPNYQSSQPKKQNAAKSLIEKSQKKNQSKKLLEVGALIIADKDKLPPKKTKISQNSDRLMLRDKQSINVISRDRKKSQAAIDKTENNIETNFLISKSSNSQAALIKQIKLPKVQPNRFNKIKQRIHKQKSLRTHKIYD